MIHYRTSEVFDSRTVCRLPRHTYSVFNAIVLILGPRFTDPVNTVTLSIFENATLDSSVRAVYAVDPDNSPRALQYSVVGSIYFYMFNNQLRTSTTNRLDAETASSITMSIKYIHLFQIVYQINVNFTKYNKVLCTHILFL